MTNLYDDGIAQGWRVLHGASLEDGDTLEADVLVIGTGAGGGTAADLLARWGLSVLMVEEGPLKTSKDFKALDEANAYASLYQEGGGRATRSGIAMLQGRSVGGSTTVNWTSSYRTPAPTLDHWARRFGARGLGVDDLSNWFMQAEARLGIAPWTMPPNANNAVLQKGAMALGWECHGIPRNVRGCWNSGYCGFGCPVNAKQSMLVTTIPEALRHGATLVHHLKVDRLQIADGERVTAATARPLHADDGRTPTGATVTLKARHVVLAAGALNSPALLLRSHAPDPHNTLGKRTFIHPVALSLARFKDEVAPYHGAPQSVASDAFLWPQDEAGIPGFKLEVPPLFPMLSSTLFMRHGPTLLADIQQLSHTNAVLALQRDGFHDESPGGTVDLGADGNPVLDYPISGYQERGLKAALLRMAECQFAAGASAVRPAHLFGEWQHSWAAAQAHIAELSLQPQQLAVFSAHLMGGCGLGEDPRTSVVNSEGSHHQLSNLTVMDGSVFPTSIGANPQLSIFGLSARNANLLAKQLRPVPAASKPGATA